MDASPRFVLLVVILIFIFLNPDQQSLRRRGQFDNEQLRELKRLDFDVIANSTYGDPIGSLNLTGFREDDGYQWQLLSPAQDASRRQHRETWDNLNAPVYQRLGGEVRGRFTRQNVERDMAKQVNLTALVGDVYLSQAFQRNVTESEGEISLSLKDSYSTGEAKEIKATISIYTDDSPGTGWEANLQGVHFPDGAVILSSASRKFHSLPALPHFALSEEQFKSSVEVVNKTVNQLWDTIFDSDASFIALPECELVVWMQQKPLSGTPRYIQQIEDELKNPDGAPIGAIPPMAFSIVIYSPDCGYILYADPVFGAKAEVYWSLVERLLIAFIIIVVLEITLLKRQMEKCATPSTRSRISFYTIGIAAFGDGLTLFAMIGLIMIEDQAFMLFAVAAFLCCMHVAFFEVKFIFDIWTVQVGEPAQAQRERQRRTAPNSSTLPPPATARVEVAVPVVLPLDQAANTPQIESPRATFASLYSKFYFALVNLMFLSLWSLSWPLILRAAYVNLLAFCYFSLWLPQIYRNMVRNCRKALNWEYVVGTSILRAIPVLYWYVDDKNVLSAETNPTTALLLIGWLWVQVAFLLSQQYLGPRLLVKESWCPPAYDYHPVLHDDLETGGLPIGVLTSASEGKDKDDRTRRVFDCAICMNEIDVPVVSKDENTGRGWLEQRNYMVTPCRHIFHTECLEGWMNLRLVCPACREGLPPL